MLLDICSYQLSKYSNCSLTLERCDNVLLLERTQDFNLWNLNPCWFNQQYYRLLGFRYS